MKNLIIKLLLKVDKMMTFFPLYRRLFIDEFIITSGDIPKTAAGRVTMANLLMKEGYIRNLKEYVYFVNKCN